MTRDRDMREDASAVEPTTGGGDGAVTGGNKTPTDAADAGGSLGIWLSMGVALGIVFGTMWDNIGLGVALGASLGIVLDAAFSAVERTRGQDDRDPGGRGRRPTSGRPR